MQKFSMHAGIGVHIDAPAHCIAGGATIDLLPFTQLVTNCVVIDVALEAHERYSVSVRDILKFENEHGPIESGSFVMIKTGWERFWKKPIKYYNHHLFPSVSREAAEELMKRKIAGLGIDNLSPDRPEDGFNVHKILLGAGKYIIENVANLVALPPTDSILLAMPIKIQNATEVPIRLIALIK